MVARSTDTLEAVGDPPRTHIRGKSGKRMSIVKGHFPKLAECAHFHYEYVDFRTVQLALAPQQADACRNGLMVKDLVFMVQVFCQGKEWLVRRSYEDFHSLDSHLHQCIYDRRFSQLPELPTFDLLRENTELIIPLLIEYLARLTSIADNNINCGPVLTWMEIDNKGNRLLVNDEAFINVPAIAAAHVIKRYTAQTSDELSFEVGDIVSVIDMPPKEDTTWWRGKHGFQVGFFPSECVQVINERLPPSNSTSTGKTDSEGAGVKLGAAGPPSPTSVSKKHGKLMGFLLNFMKSRPSRQKLKQRGILRERVFGCDLGEHLLNSGLDVPQVLKSCSDFIEDHGIVDGIYRVSGISSNIQKLRHEFDCDQIPDLTKDVYMQDIHCISSLCKLYFRELPNPLLTYQLYDRFAEAMCLQTKDERLLKVHDVIQQLPPPNYRTLQYLMRHLGNLAKHSPATSMHVKNLAIVWAPNLLRSKEIESVGFTGTDAFREVRIQSVVVEFLLRHVDILFSDKFSSAGKDSTGHNNLIRPKSTLVPSPSTRLLTLEEAQARTLAQGGEGTGAVGDRFCSINLPADRRRNISKLRKSGGGSWKTFFTLGKVSGVSRRKSQPEVGDLFNIMESDPGTRVETETLRSAKSEESLSSQHSGAGFSKLHGRRRPRSSDDALSLSGQAPAIPGFHPRSSCESLASSEKQEAIYTAPDLHLGPAEWPGPALGPGCPDCRRGLSSPAPDTASKPVSFTRKAAPASHPEGRGPPSLDISRPVAVTVPAKVLEMLGSRAGEPQASACPGPPLPPSPPPPQMISVLLQSCDFQLSRDCKQEGQRKTAVAGLEVKGQAESPDLEELLRVQNAQKPVCYQTMSSLPTSASHHVPPPPPPKDPARLMALALTERAHQVVRQASQQWQECRQHSPAPGEPPAGAYVGSLLIELDQMPIQLASPLYSTVDPLRAGSPRDHSPTDSEIGLGCRRDNLTAQDSALSPPPASLSLLDPSGPEASPDTAVKLTQSLCVQCSPRPSPAPPSLAPSNRQSQRCSVHWSDPQSPASGSPLDAQAPSPSRGASGRSMVRCSSVSAGLTLPPPPPPPKPPHLLHPCPSRCGNLPASAPDGAQPRASQIKPPIPPRPPVPQGQPKTHRPGQRPQTRARTVPEASPDRPQTRGSHRQARPPRQAALLGPGVSTARGPSPRPGRGESVKPDNLYAEILPEVGLCQCSPHPAPVPEESPPALPSRPAPRVHPRVSATPRVPLQLPPDPALPQRPLLLRLPDAPSHWAPPPGWSYTATHRQSAHGGFPARSVPCSQRDWAPYCRSPAEGHCLAALRPCFQQGRACYRHPEAPDHEMSTCPNQDAEPSPRQTRSVTGGASSRPFTRRQVPEATYVNVPVYPCRGKMPAGSTGRRQSRVQPFRAKSPRPEAGGGPMGRLQKRQSESSPPALPIRPLAGRPACYGYENVPVGSEEEEEEEEARRLESAHLRSKPDPGQSERISFEEGGRPNLHGRPGQGPKRLHVDQARYTVPSGLQLPSEKRQPPRKPHGREWPTEADWQNTHAPFLRQSPPSGEAEFARSAHRSGQCYRQTCCLLPSGQLVLNSYRPGPDCGETGYCPSPGGYASFISEPEYEEAIVTYETGPELRTLVYHGLSDGGGLQGLGKVSRVEVGPYGAQYGSPLAPQRREAPPHWAACVKGLDRSFC